MQEENQKAIYLAELINSEGWRMVEERLDLFIEEVESKLFADDEETITEIKPLESYEIELLRRQRKHLIALKNIPNQLIFETSIQVGEELDSYDPYDN